MRFERGSDSRLTLKQKPDLEETKLQELFLRGKRSVLDSQSPTVSRSFLRWTLNL